MASPNSSTKLVGVWIRVSTEDQAQGESPKNHERRARLYAEAKGWVVEEVYDLSGVSGKSVWDHPEARRMMEDVKSGRISGLIFSKLARLARNTRELLDFAEFFQDQGADLISLFEAIDTSSPAGRLFYTMIAAMAQWEREEIAHRVSAAVPIRAKMGKNTGGQASFGYQWLEGKLIPHPDEAPVRKLIYELFLKHRRRKTVARLLNEQGYRTRKGAKFTDTTVTRLIQDPTAKGEHRANYTTSQGRGKAATLKPREEWVIQRVEPIVSEEIWAECNALLQQQKNGRRPGPKGRYLFAGRVRCGCGQKMYVKTGTPKFVCESCRNKIPQDDLEAVFRDQLHAFFLSDEDLARFLSESDEEIADKEAQIRTLDAERKKIVSEREKVYRGYIDEEITGKEFGKLYRPLSERLDTINDRIPELQAEVDILRINRLSSEEVIEGARDLYGRWDTLGEEEKRYIIEAIVEDIIIGETDIEIRLHYVPGSAQQPTQQGAGSPDDLPPPPELTEKRQHKNTDSSPRSAGSAPGRRCGHWRAPPRYRRSPWAGAGNRAPGDEIRAARRETARRDGPARPRPA